MSLKHKIKTAYDAGRLSMPLPSGNSANNAVSKLVKEGYFSNTDVTVKTPTGESKSVFFLKRISIVENEVLRTILNQRKGN